MTRVTVLGCGPSTGVPMAGNNWGNCDPANPKNRRQRPSILIERKGLTLLVDAGPDLRNQLLAADVKRLDAVIITHEHADHTHGIDDLRGFAQNGHRPLPFYAPTETLGVLTERFSYMFGGAKKGYVNKPFLKALPLDPGDTLPAFGVTAFAQDHTVCLSLGLRCGWFGYSTDLARLGEEGFAALQGVKIWIVAALRREAHTAHANLATVLGWIERIKPEQAFLTHMNASLDYEALRRELPPHVAPAFDGMVIELEE